MFSLPLDSWGFPSGGPNGFSTVQVTPAKLCWAALTVGRPSKMAVSSFGKYSRFEALFRWNMVLSAIDTQMIPNRAFNSALFNALDPTEKGGINFYLGMIFLKICAQDVLSIPWLVHLHWMKQNHHLALLKGKSSPDLLGYRPSTARWGVFEAKGRNGGFSNAVLGKAKDQANRLISVDGNLCDLHVGGLLYRRAGNRLSFAWKDPEPKDKKPFELETDRKTWRNYYGAVYQLYLEQKQDRRGFYDRYGFKIGFHPIALRFVEAVYGRRDYSNEFGNLAKWAAHQMKEPVWLWNGDGIGIIVDEDRF